MYSLRNKAPSSTLARIPPFQGGQAGSTLAGVTMDCRHKPRAKRSPIWKLPAEAFRQHHSLASVLRHLGLHVGAGNYRTLRSRIVAEKIDVSHMDPNVDRVRAGARRAIPLQDILVADTPYRGGTNHIKKKLLREGLLENRCTLCGLGDTWNGAPSFIAWITSMAIPRTLLSQTSGWFVLIVIANWQLLPDATENAPEADLVRIALG